MKKYFTLLIAGATLLCLFTAFGCGTLNETTNATTPRQTTAVQTTDTTATEKTTKRTEAATTDTEAATSTEATLDPMLPLPDLDDPITDVEPNVPESGTNNDGALEDILDGSGMNGSGGTDTNGDISGMDGIGGNGNVDARRRDRGDANAASPALPTK